MISFLIDGFLAFLSGIQNSLPLVFALFKDARVAIGLAVGLVSVGIFAFAWMWLGKMMPVIRELRYATREIRSLSGPTEFFREYARIDQLLVGIPAVRPGWEEFKKHLIFPDVDPGRDAQAETPIRSTQSPDYYISIGAAEGKTMHLGFYKGMADYFVGAGLILTFVGLVAALYFAALGLQSGNLEETRASLTALLSAATFKFITSIAGIGTAMLFSMGFAASMGALHSAFGNLSEAVQAKMYFANPESVGFGQYRELRRHTEIFQRLVNQPGVVGS
jgi:hypothetical protein